MQEEQHMRSRIAYLAIGAVAVVVAGTLGLVAGWHLGLKNAPVRTVYTQESGTLSSGQTQVQTLSPSSGQQAPSSGKQTGTSGITYIDVEVAKQIALDYAGIDAADAYFTKARLDREKGRMVYEIEYYVGTTEYEFDIDAVTGDIVDVDIEYHER